MGFEASDFDEAKVIRDAQGQFAGHIQEASGALFPGSIDEPAHRTRMSNVYGTAAGGLAQGQVKGNAGQIAAGIKGEQATAEVLGWLAAQPNGPAVLHDLRIPIPGMLANVDHAVVAGDDVWLIDSKWWKPGRYWRYKKWAFRGTKRFEPAEKQTLPMAQRAYREYLQKRLGGNPSVPRPLLIVWPSKTDEKFSVRMLGWGEDGKASTPIDGRKFYKSAGYMLRPPNPQIVEAMKRMLVDQESLYDR